MSDPQGVTMFAALEPDAALQRLVQDYKDETRALVGEQLFVDDPPHLTVFLSVFPTVAAALAQWAKLPAKDVEQPVEITGWHVFDADALTGNHTLVCDLAAEDKRRLRDAQQQVIDQLAPIRDREAACRRFAPRASALDESQRAAVAEHGFPYVGAGWEPHFTIASIQPDVWPRVWRAFADRPPVGSFRCPRMRLYQLDEGVPVAVEGRDDYL
jgi:2'-5' RNA ligase